MNEQAKKILRDERIRSFFRGSLELTDEEFERRLQAYLELLPFIALDFMLHGDTGELSEQEMVNQFKARILKYRQVLHELREAQKLGNIEIKV